MNRRAATATNNPARRQRGRPVEDFPIEFEWQLGDWKDLFDEHVKFIQGELDRAQAEDRVIVYLSCPISSRGGGHHATNVDIATYTARRLMTEWGQRFFFLNPTQFQMESKEGTGLIKRHAESIAAKTKRKIDVDKLPDPGGGDYMRMWTRVLVEDDYLKDKKRQKKSLGGLFDAYYFLSPSDVRAFFNQGGAMTVTAGIEDYFARKFNMDPDFREAYSPPYKDKNDRRLPKEAEKKHCEQLRKDFFRFYSVRASADFSMGCHDEWNIWVTLNERRLESKFYELGDQIAGFYDGRQIDPAAAIIRTTPGYALID